MHQRELMNLPVATRSGMQLGKVIGFVMRSDDHHVFQYEVRRAGFHIKKHTLLIHYTQVIAITKEHMLVMDECGTEKAVEAMRAGTPLTATPTDCSQIK